MKRRLFAVLFVVGLCAIAELIKQPDENTLWIENGVNIKLDPTEKNPGRNGWASTSKDMDISYTAATEETPAFFTFKSPETKRHTTRRYVPISRDYPWLEFEILSYIPDAVAYKNFWMGIYKGQLFPINVPKPGIYIQNLWRAAPFEKAVGLIDFTIYGYEVNFSYIRIIKKPENYFCIESPAFEEKKCFENGDKLVFTAQLSHPAEDVTITFHEIRDHRPIRINGNDSISLRPTNDETTEWRAEMDVSKISSKSKTFIFKCTVLGGKLKKPMFTNNPFPYKNEAK